MATLFNQMAGFSHMTALVVNNRFEEGGGGVGIGGGGGRGGGRGEGEGVQGGL